MITISHTHAGGTLIDGTAKGDGSAPAVKAAGFRWSRNLGSWYLPQSRDKAAKTWKIGAARAALEAAGFTVTVEIDETDRRAFADAEAERYERAEDRADRMAGYAANAAARSAAGFNRAHQIADMIPFGQPILVGHHSERGHRRDLDRIDRGMRTGFEEDRKADHYERRAVNAETCQASRESVPTTLRRIAKLEAEERQIQRERDGIPSARNMAFAEEIKPAAGEYRARLESRLADIADELGYWREHVAKRAADGVKVWSKADFAKGDFAKFLGSWYEVLRVNAKSVTIPAMINDGHVITQDGARCTWTDTVPYHKIKGRKSAEEMAAILADPAAAPAEFAR
jgi:hypothetical protein